MVATEFKTNFSSPHHQSFYMAPQKTLTIKSDMLVGLPFFCAMECKVRKHTNIWLKLRAGDDASYMKMIEHTSYN